MWLDRFSGTRSHEAPLAKVHRALGILAPTHPDLQRWSPDIQASNETQPRAFAHPPRLLRTVQSRPNN